MNKKNDTPEKVPFSAGDAENNMDANQDEPAGEADRAASPDLDLGAMGAQLRGLYKELLDEPVPDRFIKLLEELEEKDPGKQ